MKKFFSPIALLATCIFAAAQNSKSDEIFSVPQAAKDKAAELVSKMTLEEKIDYIGGFKDFYIRPIERLGIPEIRMADGPQGVRNNTKSTMFPSGIAVASTWNRDLIYKMGEGLGQDPGPGAYISFSDQARTSIRCLSAAETSSISERIHISQEKQLLLILKVFRAKELWLALSILQ